MAFKDCVSLLSQIHGDLDAISVAQIITAMTQVAHDGFAPLRAYTAMVSSSLPHYLAFLFCLNSFSWYDFKQPFFLVNAMLEFSTPYYEYVLGQG